MSTMRLHQLATRKSFNKIHSKQVNPLMMMKCLYEGERHKGQNSFLTPVKSHTYLKSYMGERVLNVIIPLEHHGLLLGAQLLL
jgi:hypothetical protein